MGEEVWMQMGFWESDKKILKCNLSVSLREGLQNPTLLGTLG